MTLREPGGWCEAIGDTGTEARIPDRSARIDPRKASDNGSPWRSEMLHDMVEGREGSVSESEAVLVGCVCMWPRRTCTKLEGMALRIAAISTLCKPSSFFVFLLISSG